MSEPIKAYVGIDISKTRLDIFELRSRTHWQVANDDQGCRPLAAQLANQPEALMVLEATGGYEIPVISALLAKALLPVVINPLSECAMSRKRPAERPKSDCRM